MSVHFFNNTHFFSIGSLIRLKTCLGQEIEGEVLAFEPKTKMLVLKTTASNQNPKLNDVQFINMALMSEFRVFKRKHKYYVKAARDLDFDKLEERLEMRVKERKEEVEKSAMQKN